jgi:hypothetical protein
VREYNSPYAESLGGGGNPESHKSDTCDNKLHAPASLPPEKEPQYPLDRRLGGPKSRSARYGEVNILDSRNMNEYEYRNSNSDP